MQKNLLDRQSKFRQQHHSKTKREVEIAFIDDIEYIELSSSNGELSIKRLSFQILWT